jgi:hypothetical protein
VGLDDHAIGAAAARHLLDPVPKGRRRSFVTWFVERGEPYVGISRNVAGRLNQHFR